MMLLYIVFEVIIVVLTLLIVNELIGIIKDGNRRRITKCKKKPITSNKKIKTEKYKEDDNINNVF